MGTSAADRPAERDARSRRLLIPVDPGERSRWVSRSGGKGFTGSAAVVAMIGHPEPPPTVIARRRHLPDEPFSTPENSTKAPLWWLESLFPTACNTAQPMRQAIRIAAVLNAPLAN